MKMMDKLDYIKKELMKYRAHEIVIWSHAREQAAIRGIKIDEIIENILNPERLVHIIEQPAKYDHETKVECWFSGKDPPYDLYVVILAKKLFVCTVIRRERRWEESQQ